MRKTNTTVTEYIELYEQEWSRLMAKQHAFASCEDTDPSILTTWTLSFNSLRSQSDSAANLLMLCSFLDGQDIWYELFLPIVEGSLVDSLPSVVKEVPPWLADCIGHKLDFKENMGLLLEYSFIDANHESSSYSIHSVLHSWCFHQCKETMTSMGWLALTIVSLAGLSETRLASLLGLRRLLPHCDRICSTLQWLLRKAVRNEKDLDSVIFACDALAKMHVVHGKSEDAESMFLGELTGLEEIVPDSIRTYYVAKTLGTVYLEHGKMREAEAWFLLALEGFQKHWGPDRGLAHGPLPELGDLYSQQGKTKQAQDAYLRSLKAKEKTFGFEDSSTLVAARALGIFYDNQGRTKEAEDVFLPALKILEKGSRLDHELLPTFMFDLGRLYSKDQYKVKEAEEMYVRALAGFEKIFGLGHGSVPEVQYELGILFSKDPCKMKEAEEMYLGALASNEKIHGLEHINVLKVQYRLGILYSKDPCKRKKAEEMYVRTLAGLKKIFGPENEIVTSVQLDLHIFYTEDPSKMKGAERYAVEGIGRVSKDLRFGA